MKNKTTTKNNHLHLQRTFTSIAVYASQSQKERKESDQTVVASCAKTT